MPGGNCIVAAGSLNMCKADGSDGNPSSIGQANYGANGQFGIINGNCSSAPSNKGLGLLDLSKVADYYKYKTTGYRGDLFSKSMLGNYSGLPTQPMFSLNGGGTSGEDVEVNVNLG